MPLEPDDFRTFSNGGLTIERDRKTRNKILALAGKVLAEKRRGTELDDHLSGDIVCPRRSVLDRISALNKTKDTFVGVDRLIGDDSPPEGYEYSRTYDRYYDPEPLVQELDGQKTIFFGFGHAFQDFMFGGDKEIAMWDDVSKLWYSPDGVDVFGEGDFQEFKTTRQSPIRKDFREAGLSIEGVLAFKNEDWFRYILAVMKRTETNEYWLTVAWIVGADMESFHVTATDEMIEENEQYLAGQRKVRRESLDGLISFDDAGVLQVGIPTALNLPPLNLRKGMWECDFCHHAAKEPCASEIPAQNALEKLRIKEEKAKAKAEGRVYLQR